jgi:hypothetical protein
LSAFCDNGAGLAMDDDADREKRMVLAAGAFRVRLRRR